MEGRGAKGGNGRIPAGHQGLKVATRDLGCGFAPREGSIRQQTAEV